MNFFNFFKKKIVREKEIITIYKSPTIYIKKRDTSFLSYSINNYIVKFDGNNYISSQKFQRLETYKETLPVAFIEFCGYKVFKKNEEEINKMIIDVYVKNLNFASSLFSIISSFPDAVESFDKLNKNEEVKKDQSEFSDNFSYLFGKLRKNELDLQIGMGNLYDDLKTLMDELEEKIFTEISSETKIKKEKY